MTDFVLMPEEATPEMEQAAEKYWNDRKFKALSDDPRTWKGLYAAMRAVAPAVQGEPVGYIRRSAIDLMEGDELGVRANIIKEPRYPDCVALYTSPQPAEQQREPCHECGGNGAGGEHEEDCSQQVAPDEERLLAYAEDLIRRLREWKTSSHRKQRGGK